MKRTILAATLLVTFGMAQGQAEKRTSIFKKQKAVSSRMNKPAFFGKKAALLPDSVETFQLDGTPGQYLTASSMMLYTYDANGHVNEEVRKYNTGNFVSRNTFQYQGNLLTESASYSWDGATWKLENKEFLHYDQHGEDTAGFVYIFSSPADSALDYAWRKSVVYDGSSRITGMTFYDFKQSAWKPSEKVTFSYNGSESSPYEATVQEYDSDMDVWNDAYRYLNLRWDLGFSSEMEPTISLEQQWDGNDWVGTFYDSAVVAGGNITDEFNYENFGSFELYGSYHYAYDNKGSLVMSLILSHIGGVDTQYLHLDTFQYGSSDEILEHVRVSRDYSNPMLYGFKEIYHYRNVSYEAPQPGALSVFPNPVTAGGKITINLDGITGLTLWDAKGQAIKVWEGESLENPETSGVQPGIYFLRASAEGRIYTTRLVVQ